MGNISGRAVENLLKTLAALTLALAACAREPAVEVPAQGIVQLSDQFTGEFDLINQNGARTTSEDFRGRVMVVYFGFATCPDVCPLAVNRLSAALNELDEDQRSEIAPVFITVDPERDTPETLKAYLGFDPRITGLTGDMAAIDAAKAAYKMTAQKQPLPGSAADYTMQHMSLFFLVDRDGAPWVALHDFLTPEELAEMLRRAIRR